MGARALRGCQTLYPTQYCPNLSALKETLLQALSKPPGRQRTRPGRSEPCVYPHNPNSFSY